LDKATKKFIRSPSLFQSYRSVFSTVYGAGANPMIWRHITFLSLLLFTVVTITGCSAEPMPAAPDTGGLVIELHTDPDPPVAGQVALIVTIKDAGQQAVDNADVNLLVSHSSMASMLLQNEAANTGNGQYSASFDFSQDSQGEWRVTVEVRNVQPKTIRKNFVITIS